MERQSHCGPVVRSDLSKQNAQCSDTGVSDAPICIAYLQCHPDGVYVSVVKVTF